MCLEKNRFETKKFKKENKDNHKIKVYKVICCFISNPQLQSIHKCYVWQEGVNQSTIRYKWLAKLLAYIPFIWMIGKGIHVYTTITTAHFNKEMNYYSHCYQIMELEADIDDLISCGNYEQAVFSEVNLAKEEYQRLSTLRERIYNEQTTL